MYSWGTTLKESTGHGTGQRWLLPPVTWDRESRTPLYLQLYKVVKRAIMDGAIPPGSRLPSTRMAATLLGVSRNTVVLAYEELAAEDLVRGILGSGTRVRGVPLAAHVSSADWRDVICESHFPSQPILFNDLDGNSLYLNRIAEKNGAQL